MKKEVQFATFIITFLILIFSMHFYVFSTLFDLFSLSKGLLFYILIIILSLSYVISGIFERKIPGIFSRGFYITSVIWFGAIWFSFWITIIYDLSSFFVSIDNVIAGTIIISLDLLLVCYGLINGQFIRKTRIKLEFNKEKLKQNVKIVHLTDIHLGTVNTRPFLAKVVRKTIEEKPDLVLLTGDLVDGSAPLSLEMLKPLEKIKTPIYFVIGNHEIYDDLDFVLPILKKTKLKIIRNSVVNYRGIQIAGIDFYEGKKQAPIEIKKLEIDEKKFSILLNHAPTGFEEAAKLGFDLQLSGHTHKGQIFPFELFVRMFYKYVSGLFKVKESYLYVSQGTGTWGPPMRVGSRSEIVVIDLERK